MTPTPRTYTWDQVDGFVSHYERELGPSAHRKAGVLVGAEVWEWPTGEVLAFARGGPGTPFGSWVDVTDELLEREAAAVKASAGDVPAGPPSVGGATTPPVMWNVWVWRVKQHAAFFGVDDVQEAGPTGSGNRRIWYRRPDGTTYALVVRPVPPEHWGYVREEQTREQQPRECGLCLATHRGEYSYCNNCLSVFDNMARAATEKGAAGVLSPSSSVDAQPAGSDPAGDLHRDGRRLDRVRMRLVDPEQADQVREVVAAAVAYPVYRSRGTRSGEQPACELCLEPITKGERARKASSGHRRVHAGCVEAAEEAIA